MKAEDGDAVDSELERRVDNALSIAGLKHYIHPHVLDSDFQADFKVGDVFVEVWKIKDEKYQERSKRKLNYYIAKGLNNRLVEIEGDIMPNIILGTSKVAGGGKIALIADVRRILGVKNGSIIVFEKNEKGEIVIHRG